MFLLNTLGKKSFLKIDLNSIFQDVDWLAQSYFKSILGKYAYMDNHEELECWFTGELIMIPTWRET